MLAAHFFVFYFGIVADITPPVALAAYAGAAIAKAPPMKTAINASRLAIAAFIVPYIIAMNPAMLFINTTIPEVVMITITSLVGENPVRSWWTDSAHSWNTDRYYWICPGWHCVCSWLSVREEGKRRIGSIKEVHGKTHKKQRKSVDMRVV